jgi:outer membrane protein, heavy metal efflux system
MLLNDRRIPRHASPPPRAFRAAVVCSALSVLWASRLVAQRTESADTTGRAMRMQPDARAARLGDLYDEARRESPRAEAARALVRAARARISSATRPPDPELQLGLMNYTVPGLKPMDPLGMTQLQLMQMVPVAGKLGLSGRVATAQAAAQAERASDVEWELRSNVAMVFYELYRTDQQLAVGRETLRLLQDIRKTTEAMYRVGEGRQADVLRAQVEIARMVEDTIRMTTMRTGMAARLNAILDRPANAAVGGPVVPVFPSVVTPLDSLLTAAEAERPMVRAGVREVEVADARAKLARRELWPDLTVGVQYGQRTGEMGAERMGSVMLGASLPIFARSRQLQMREEATAMRQMAAADLAAMRADTRARVAEAYASLVRARNLAALYRTTVLPQAEAAAASALAAYRVGGVDFMTLLDDRMTVNTYRQELFALEAEQGKAWAELEMLIGRELFDANQVTGRVATAGERP